jgi:glutamyl-tRNA synthetase
LDDQVILKSDGFPTYHLAVVVDDHFMEITHVTRGQEWIPSTPKHLLLYKAFGWEPTLFAHFPSILNPDKTKLSKRQGDVSVEDFLRKGYLKEALLNFVAFLGWNPKTEQEVFSMDDLIKHFDFANINRAGAVFDLEKLDWMNGLYIRSKKIEELTELLIPFWQKDGYIEISGDSVNIPNLNLQADNNYLYAVAGLERERLKKLSEIGERTRYFFAEPEYAGELLVWKKSTKEDAKVKLSALRELFQKFSDSDFELKTLEEKIKTFISANGYDNGSVLWPLRVGLTGLEKSPGPFEVASVLGQGLGKEKLLERLDRAIAKL